jgi:hypothetical protein
MVLKSGEHKVFRKIEIFEDGRKIKQCLEKYVAKNKVFIITCRHKSHKPNLLIIKTLYIVNSWKTIKKMKNKRTQIWSCKVNHLIIKKLENKIL